MEGEAATATPADFITYYPSTNNYCIIFLL